MAIEPACPDERPVLLIVGSSATGRRALLQRLIAESASPAGARRNELWPDAHVCLLLHAGVPHSNCDSAVANGDHVPDELTLDNKYYTARVRVSLATPQLTPTVDTVVDHEAQLLLFEANSEASFDAVRDWAHRNGCEEGGENEPDIKLCIATTTEALPAGGGAEPQQTPWLEASRQWASDNLYEYVELSSTSSRTGTDTGRGPDGERQGIARILEALQAHAWSGLHRKAPPPVGRALRTAAAPPLRMPAVDRDGDSPAGQRTGNGAASAAEPAAANGFLEGPDVLSFREFLSSNDAAIGGAKLDDEDEGEERFDQLMASFAGHRQRLQQLPDSQRRQAAERMALQMMEAFGLDDADESDDSDS